MHHFDRLPRKSLNYAIVISVPFPHDAAYFQTNAKKLIVVKKKKTLEKSGLKPLALIRLADRKHCTLSTQPDPHL